MGQGFIFCQNSFLLILHRLLLGAERHRTMTKVRLRLEHDCDTESPNNWGGWKAISFNNRRVNYQDPYDFFDGLNDYGEVIPAHIGIQRKLDCGTAFVLSCYEHSGIVWGLRGEVFQCRWDTTTSAGILLWQGKAKHLPKGDDKSATYEARQEDARAFIREYTRWANGECYCYSIENEDEEIIDSCGGFIGTEHLFDTIKEQLEDCDVVEVVGEAAYLMDHCDMGVEGPELSCQKS